LGAFSKPAAEIGLLAAEELEIVAIGLLSGRDASVKPILGCAADLDMPAVTVANPPALLGRVVVRHQYVSTSLKIDKNSPFGNRIRENLRLRTVSG